MKMTKVLRNKNSRMTRSGDGSIVLFLFLLSYLEGSAEPPDLEERLADDNADDKHVPPLDTAVGALGGVAVGSLAHDDVGLFVFNLVEEIGEFAD